jgi:hypothetical protein
MQPVLDGSDGFKAVCPAQLLLDAANRSSIVHCLRCEYTIEGVRRGDDCTHRRSYTDICAPTSPAQTPPPHGTLDVAPILGTLRRPMSNRHVHGQPCGRRLRPTAPMDARKRKADTPQARTVSVLRPCGDAPEPERIRRRTPVGGGGRIGNAGGAPTLTRQRRFCRTRGLGPCLSSSLRPARISFMLLFALARRGLRCGLRAGPGS